MISLLQKGWKLLWQSISSTKCSDLHRALPHPFCGFISALCKIYRLLFSAFTIFTSLLLQHCCQVPRLKLPPVCFILLTAPLFNKYIFCIGSAPLWSVTSSVPPLHMQIHLANFLCVRLNTAVPGTVRKRTFHVLSRAVISLKSFYFIHIAWCWWIR